MQFLGISHLSRAVAVCWSLHQLFLRSFLKFNKSSLTRVRAPRWTHGAINIHLLSTMLSCNNSSHLSLMLYSPSELDRANSVDVITSLCRPLHKNMVLSYPTRGAQFKKASMRKSGSSASFQISLNSKRWTRLCPSNRTIIRSLLHSSRPTATYPSQVSQLQWPLWVALPLRGPTTPRSSRLTILSSRIRPRLTPQASLSFLQQHLM